MKYITTVEGKEYQVEVLDEKHASVNGTLYNIDFESVNGQPVFSVLVDGKSFETYVYPGEQEWQVLLLGRMYQVKVEDEREKRLRAAAGGSVAEGVEFHLKAPMPGLITPQQVDNACLAVVERRKLDVEEQTRLDRAMDRAWANLPEHYQWLKNWEYV